MLPLIRPGLVATTLLAIGAPDAVANPDALRDLVQQTVRPVMAEHQVPGMAVGVTLHGAQHYFCFGVADKDSSRPVAEDTVFEVGSISKTFTATLGGFALAEAKLSLDDRASSHMAKLAGSPVGSATLLELATYTAGGLPLQFPDEVSSPDSVIAYFAHFRPPFQPGTRRQYSNPSIGLFGMLTARAYGLPFRGLMQDRLLPAMGLASTWIDVPSSEMQRYAWGTSKEGKKVRVNPGPLDAEAYGIKSSLRDVVRFLELNIDPSSLEPSLQEAIAATHTGYYRVGKMTQGLGWEMLAWPTELETLAAATTLEWATEPREATKLELPMLPQKNLWHHKTGSTGGFGAYVAFVPAHQVGIVLLANRNYPNSARVTAAYKIVSFLTRAK